jgi:hypothetical protein
MRYGPQQKFHAQTFQCSDVAPPSDVPVRVLEHIPASESKKAEMFVRRSNPLREDVKGSVCSEEGKWVLSLGLFLVWLRAS